MFTISRKSPFSGKVNSMELPLTIEQYEEALERWNSGVLIQNAFPMLDAGQREFIKTGITPEEWNSLFGDKE